MRIATTVGELAVRLEGNGPDAVLWHSLFVDDHSWDRVSPALAEERRLIRITGPGHGDSERVRRSFTLDDCASAAIEVLDFLHVGRPVDWVGNAWGGHVGIVLAAIRPDLVRSLVAFGSPVAPLTSGEASRVRLLMRVLRVVGPARRAVKGVVDALVSPRTRADDSDAIAYVRRCLRVADRRALINAIGCGSLARPDLTPLLGQITAATVFVASSDGILWTPQQARAAVAQMPDAEAVILGGTLHLAPLEMPDLAADVVTRLWRRSSPTR